MSVILLFLSVLITIITAFASAETRNVAVLDFEGVGLSESETVVITERLRKELMVVKSFKILERERMASVPDEQDFKLCRNGG